MTTTEPARVAGMPRIGDAAPAFTAVTTQGEINFPADYAGKWVIFFSHPADFTPVCTSEFMTFASMQKQFAGLKHRARRPVHRWSLQPHRLAADDQDKITFCGMKDVEVTFPLIEDISMKIAEKYGMIMPGEDSTKAVRAVFVVDPKGKIRTIIYYPLSLGRNFDELLRVIKALRDRRPLRRRHTG